MATTTTTTPTCKWPGKSGQTYTYYIYSIGASFKEEAGNYIFCKLNASGQWVPQYIGQTENLNQRLGNHEKEVCAKRNGATHIHAHLTSVEATRLAEEKDLIQTYNPPCNIQHVI
ncbi:MAG: GIY-YIG nuclease family protein [Verrucomicrobiota bacterium]